MSTSPVVALVAPNGMLGKHVVPIFLKAVQDGDFKKLRFLTSSNPTPALQDAATANPDRVEVLKVNYNEKASIDTALQGVDVLVNAIGIYGKESEVLQNLIESAAAQGVKVYFPSEYGSDYDSDTLGFPLFEGKKIHRLAAEKLGLKVVAVATGGFSDSVRNPALETDGDTWTSPGDGNTHFASTDISDVARYLVRAVVLSFKDPSFPRRLRVYSDLKTWNEYADISEKVTGQPIARKFISQDELDSVYKSGTGGPFWAMRVILMSDAVDFSHNSHNELLNPGEKFFKPIKWEESYRKIHENL